MTRQIDAQGLLLRKGTLIDASLVEAQVRRLRKPAALAAEPAAEPEAGSVAAPEEVLAAPEAPLEAAPRPPRLLVANPRWTPRRAGPRGELGKEGRAAVFRLQGACRGGPWLEHHPRRTSHHSGGGRYDRGGRR